MRMPTMFAATPDLIERGGRYGGVPMRWYWRYLLAWRVFIGRYDALVWPGSESSGSPGPDGKLT